MGKRPTEFPEVAYWQGKQLSKMSRADLEAEFVALARQFDGALPHERTRHARIALDEYTQTVVDELGRLIVEIESGVSHVTYFAPVTDAEGDKLRRQFTLRTTITPKRPS